MRQALLLYTSFFRIHLMKNLAYRGAFIMNVILVCIESITVYIGLRILYGHVDTIAGWSYHQTLVLSGVFMLSNALSWLLFKAGLNKFEALLQQGALDWILVKPVDTQLLVTIHEIDLEDAVRSVVAIPLLVIGLAGQPVWQTISMIPVSLFLLLCGQVVLYSIMLLIACLSFHSLYGWATRSIYWRFHELAKYPTDVYTGLMRIIYTFVFPLVFIATVPTKALVGTLTPLMVLGAITAAIVSFTVSRMVWKRAIKGYSSASS